MEFIHIIIMKNNLALFSIFFITACSNVPPITLKEDRISNNIEEIVVTKKTKTLDPMLARAMKILCLK